MIPYRTAPSAEEQGWPSGVRYIVGNEGCERFSYYGMSAILYTYIVALHGSEDFATSIVHLFASGVYAFPLIGAVIADRLLGKYHTILWFSLLYCLGHFVLSMTEGSMTGLYVGLSLIAVGAGGIKPCVSAHVGDQFGKSNWHLITKVYQLFYFIINFGSFFATLLIPLTQIYFGWRVAFGIPGILMFIATFVFWMGRHEFVHVPARPGGKLGLLDASSSVLFFAGVGALLWKFWGLSLGCIMTGLILFQLRQKRVQDDGFMAVTVSAMADFFRGLFYRLSQLGLVFQTAGSSGTQAQAVPYVPQLRQRFSEEAIEGTWAVIRITSIFLFVSVFWALFDQHASSWIRQAQLMNRHLGSIELLASQIQSINPILVMILIPVMAKLFKNLKPLFKMSIGMAVGSLSFVSVAVIQYYLDVGVHLHVIWQLLPYTLITLAEVLVSVTGLEFAYTQAPKRMKSTVMGFWLLSVTLGNMLVAFTAHFAHLPLLQFFELFAALMALAALLFALRAYFYVPRSYFQS